MKQKGELSLIPNRYLLLMIQILHDLKDPQLWEFGILLIMGTAGFISSTAVYPPKP